MSNFHQIFSQVSDEINRTRKRVDRGELPANLVDISPSASLAVLVEEIGEVAELCKISEGRKPGAQKILQRETAALPLSFVLKDRLRTELIQIAAIAIDWASSDLSYQLLRAKSRIGVPTH